MGGRLNLAQCTVLVALLLIESGHVSARMKERKKWPSRTLKRINGAITSERNDFRLVSCRACSGTSLSSGAMSRSRFLSADETNIRIKPPRLAALDRSL